VLRRKTDTGISKSRKKYYQLTTLPVSNTGLVIEQAEWHAKQFHPKRKATLWYSIKSSVGHGNNNMQLRTIKLRKLKNQLDTTLKQIPQANQVEYRYRTLRKTLQEIYPNLIGNTSKETMLEFLQDAVYLDRLLRRKTTGKQTTLKSKLAKDFVKHL